MTALGRIAWWGDPAPRKEILARLEQIGFGVETLPSGSLRDFKAVVYFLANDECDLAPMTAGVARALDEAVNVVIVSPTDAAVAEARRKACARALAAARIVGKLHHRIVGGEVRESTCDPDDVVRYLMVTPRSAQENADLAVTLDEPAKGLLRRAFFDFNEIRLAPLIGGMANLGVYKVIGTMGGERPTPYLAKVATRENILKELHAFHTFVRDFVPFANRPNFVEERSHLTAHYGVLVGQLAERTVNLDEAVRRDGATAAIHELFLSVLQRWWSNSFHTLAPVTSQLRNTNVVSSWLIPDDHPRREILEFHRNLAEKAGLPIEPHEKIRKLLGEHDVALRLGAIHGDLNSGNVLVRGRTPLIVDFSHAARGPLHCDPAWLEVNLVFGRDWGNGWSEAVTSLYGAEWLRRVPPPHAGEDFDDELHHLCTAVRSIRKHSAEASVPPGDDYPRIVGAALLRFASLERKSDVPEIEKKMRLRSARAYSEAGRIAAELMRA